MLVSAENALAAERDPDEAADPDDPDAIDPFAMLAVALLRARARPDDPRITALAARFANHHCDSRRFVEALASSLRAQRWGDLFDAILVPLRATRPPINAILHHVGRGDA